MQLTVAARVGVVGSGTMGAGIAQIAAQAGHPVLLLDAVEGRAQNAVDGVGAQWDRMVGMGRLDPGASAAARADLKSAADVADLAGCALVIEAAVESLDIKRSIFAGLEAVVDDDCVLATQHLLAVDHRGPGRPPAAWTLYRRAFLQPRAGAAAGGGGFRAGDRPAGRIGGGSAGDHVGEDRGQGGLDAGFIVNRVARPFYGEALRALDEADTDPADIDAVFREAGGFRMGPLELTDLPRVHHAPPGRVERKVAS